VPSKAHDALYHLSGVYTFCTGPAGGACGVLCLPLGERVPGCA